MVRPFGVEVRRLRHDLDSRLLASQLVEQALHDAARTMVGFLAGCPPFTQALDIDELAEGLVAFYARYESSRARAVHGGARLNKLLWLFAAARLMRPSAIIESGTFRGTSAWAMAMACPDAIVHTFDVEDAGIAERAANVRYHRGDWTSREIDGLVPAATLVFFDDHVDQARRLLEAHAAGFRWLLFDDDLDIRSFPRHCSDVGPLPKISMLFDPDLHDGEHVGWLYAGHHNSYTVDGSYFARARACIEATARLPDLSPVTGFDHQSPLTLVRLRPPV